MERHVVRLRATIFATTAWTFVSLVVFQFFLAGLGLFAPDADFSMHRAMGQTWLPVAALALFLGAAVGGRSRLDVTAAVAAFALVVFTGSLPSRAEAAPLLAAFHPVAALATFAIGSFLARRSITALRSGAANDDD
jgi:hypothetical protein